MADNPKVFISYSHDSPEHKRWVSQLGAELRRNGIDAILDQWDLGLGNDVTRFMESGLMDSDRVLVICTDSYVGKANAGEGGVGYERMIVTAQIVQDLGTNKFIPIIRQASGQKKMPICLGARFYLDFTDDNQFDEKFHDLLRELHRVPFVEKPPLGKNPFAKLPSGQEIPPDEGVDTQLSDIPEQIESASESYAAAVKLARVGDVDGWSQFVRRIQPLVFESLVQWRQDELDGQFSETKQSVQVVDKAVDISSSLMSVALAGVESGREQFRDQSALLNNLINIMGWDLEGYMFVVEIPLTLGYVYHSLHGGLSLITNQFDLALNLARHEVPDVYYQYEEYDQEEFLCTYKMRELVGWLHTLSPDPIASDPMESWKYLINAYERWEWLSRIFLDDREYRSSLVAYYVALNIHELAELIASGQQSTLSSMSPFDLRVSLGFMCENRDIYQSAISLLRRNPNAVKELWTSLNVTHEQMENLWKNWVRLLANWLGSDLICPSLSVKIYYQNLVDHGDFFQTLQL